MQTFDAYIHAHVFSCMCLHARACTCMHAHSVSFIHTVSLTHSYTHVHTERERVAIEICVLSWLEQVMRQVDKYTGFSDLKKWNVTHDT